MKWKVDQLDNNPFSLELPAWTGLLYHTRICSPPSSLRNTRTLCGRRSIDSSCLWPRGKNCLPWYSVVPLSGNTRQSLKKKYSKFSEDCRLSQDLVSTKLQFHETSSVQCTSKEMSIKYYSWSRVFIPLTMPLPVQSIHPDTLLTSFTIPSSEYRSEPLLFNLQTFLALSYVKNWQPEELTPLCRENKLDWAEILCQKIFCIIFFCNTKPRHTPLQCWCYLEELRQWDKLRIHLHVGDKLQSHSHSQNLGSKEETNMGSHDGFIVFASN